MDTARAHGTRGHRADHPLNTRSCVHGLCLPTKNWKKIRQPTSIPLVKKIAFSLTSPYGIGMTSGKNVRRLAENHPTSDFGKNKPFK